MGHRAHSKTAKLYTDQATAETTDLTLPTKSASPGACPRQTVRLPSKTHRLSEAVLVRDLDIFLVEVGWAAVCAVLFTLLSGKVQESSSVVEVGLLRRYAFRGCCKALSHKVAWASTLLRAVLQLGIHPHGTRRTVCERDS